MRPLLDKAWFRADLRSVRIGANRRACKQVRARIAICNVARQGSVAHEKAEI